MGLSTERGGRARARGDDGAALVEFSLVMVLLFTLIFGIISFGLILSFKQDMTRAAAEGARAGAVAFPAGDNARDEAYAALDDAVSEFGGPNWEGTGCSTNQRDGFDCFVDLIECPPLSSTECVIVELDYDYESFPLFGDIPLVEKFMPDTLSADSVARTNA